MAIPEKNDLETKIFQLGEENAALKRQVKSLRSEDVIHKLLVKEIASGLKPMGKLPRKHVKVNHDVVEEDMVLHLSDMHGDEVILPHMVGNLENYNFQRCCVRAETLVNNLLQMKANLSGYHFPNLWILANGDFSSGEIHDAQNHSAYGNIIKNCFAISRLLALMTRDLSQHFDNIYVACVPGNHGRRTKRKDYNSPHNSWDYMIYESWRLLSTAIPNISFSIPEAYSVAVNIRGFTFVVEHGDDINAWNGIPFYGLERKTRRLAALQHITNQKIDYYCIGHWHNASVLSNQANSETVVNGAWPATSPFVYNKMGLCGMPNQFLHGVGAGGMSWRYRVPLRSKDEGLGPQRYLIDYSNT